jgi:hypothetical protein
MRIIIDIDGEVVTVRTEPATTGAHVYASDAVPPDVLRAAAARGATSAGPAPAEPERAPEEIEARATEPVDAGPGPFAPPGKVVEQEKSDEQL